jgi:hypothetical protein
MQRNQLVTRLLPRRLPLVLTSAALGAVSLDIANGAGLHPKGILKCRTEMDVPAGVGA